MLLGLVALAGGAFYLWRGFSAVPAFYQAAPLEGAERLRAIESVERKVLNLQSVLDRAYARAQAGPSATTQPAEDDLFPDAGDVQRVAVSFSGPELDTYFRKWLDETGYGPRLAKYMQDPRIGVEGGHVILAGRMPEFGAIVGMHFLPVADEDGAVHLRLEGVYAGRIRLPEVALEKFRTLTVDALGENLPRLRREAEISPQGFANEAAILAASQSQLMALFEGKEIEPLITFVPLPGRGFVAARISELSVADDELILAVELLDESGRQQLLREIRDGS